MTRSRRARREASRRREKESSANQSTPANLSKPANAAPAAKSTRKATRAHVSRPWYRQPQVQQAIYIIGSSVVVALVVWFFYQQQQAANAPVPTAAVIIETPSGSATVPAANAGSPTAAASPQARKTYTAVPAMTINTSAIYTATIATAKGNIVMQLDPKLAPQTVNNFVTLAKDGFYNGLTFHRVEDWVIQGGDPVGNGTGGPGYKFNDEPVQGEYVRGAVAMANSGPNTNGSQFFILKKDTPLPKNYNLFGKVVSGMEVVDNIAIGDKMTSVTITGG